MQDYFFSLADTITPLLRGDEVFLCNFAAEDSDFVRFNHGRVRQAGTVTQRELTLDLIAGRRHAAATSMLAGDFAGDRDRVALLVRDLRAKREQVPEDPHLLYATEVRSGTRRQPNRLPHGPDAVAEVLRVGEGRDLVGLYAAGGTYAGFANSLGQRNWSATYSYNVDWSFHLAGDKAVKTSYAGFTWSADGLERKAALAAEQLALLSRPVRTLAPGRYRVYLAPAAMFDLVELLGWGGFGLRAHRTKTTPLLRMIEGGARLHSGVTILENTAEGIAPDFQEAGFLRPARVTLIEHGVYRDCLVSPRSSLEYGVATNGATAGESPLSVDVAAGNLPLDRIVSRLGTGIFASNLWYLNYSDRSACRMTGMTRFATFWVDRGVAQAPLVPMRFDDTLYRMLGEQLVGLTQERELIFDADTYGRRSTRSARLPGAIVEDLTFTL
jgi:predicted Zn-dependent protease